MLGKLQNEESDVFTPLLRRDALWFDYPKTPPPVLAATKSSLFWWLLIGGLTVFKHSGHTPGPGLDISDQGFNSGPMSMLMRTLDACKFIRVCLGILVITI